jgi:hypothetical protein
VLHCHHCGAHAQHQTSVRGGGSFSFAAGDGIDPLAELTAQAKSAPPELAAIIRIVRDRLKVQDRSADVIERGLKRVYDSIMDAIRDVLARVPGASIAERARRLALNGDAIERIINEALAASPGLDADGRPLPSLLDDVANAQAELAEMVAKGQTAVGLPAQVSATAIRAAASDFQRRFFGSTIVGPSVDRLLDGLQSSLAGESLDAAISRIREAQNASIPTATTEARTRIAEFDRAVTAQSAAEAGADLFTYRGPVDGITRGFCAELEGLALTTAQIGRLNNAQTATSPLYSGGGYNCRHNWSPLSAALAEAIGAPMGTDAMVKAANRAAKGSR